MAADAAEADTAGTAMSEQEVAEASDKKATGRKKPEAAPPEPPAVIPDTLHGKIAEVQGVLGVMAKDRHVDVKKNGQLQYSYDYLSESALMSAVRTELSKRGVAVYVSVDDQRREGQLTLVQTSLTFVDGPTGQKFFIRGQGQGADPSDKGVYKAITGAVRYMLWKTFLIPTEGDDPNQPHEVSSTASDAPVSIAEAVPRIGLFAGDVGPWITEAMVGFYPDAEEGTTVKAFTDAHPDERYDLIRRLQRVVLELEAVPNFDIHGDMEKTRALVRLAFAKAFEGLAVGGPDPFVGPEPF